MNCGGMSEIYRRREVEHIADEADTGMSPATAWARHLNEDSEMVIKKARVTVWATAFAAALLCSPVAVNAQTTDTARTTYTTTPDNNRGFNWGWLGLLGLLGLLPKKRKETVTETRTT